MNRQDISVRKYYVNERMRQVREVTGMDHQTVSYNLFDLQTGSLCGSLNKYCQKNQFIRWVDREATSDEVQMLQHGEAETLFDISNPPAIEILKAEIAMAGTREEVSHTHIAS